MADAAVENGRRFEFKYPGLVDCSTHCIANALGSRVVLVSRALGISSDSEFGIPMCTDPKARTFPRRACIYFASQLGMNVRVSRLLGGTQSSECDTHVAVPPALLE